MANANPMNGKPKKKVTFGVEFELFTLDKTGKMANNAAQLIESVKKKYPAIDIVKECGKNMVEMRSAPDASIPNAMLKILEDFECVLHNAEAENIVLYPYGTYPGEFEPLINEDKAYRIKEKILGRKRFSIAARCIGMHCHYSLPKGVFDFSNKFLNILATTKNKDILSNMYNLFIAVDPALTTFTQSSPFYQGKYVGKDSRVIVYRGGRPFNFPGGLYENYPEFGALQPYKLTHIDFSEIIQKQFYLWNRIISSFDVNLSSFARYGSILDTTWNPVRINAHGTMEQRGMDMNRPGITVAIATLVKAISVAVHTNYLEVEASLDAISKPFRFEGNTIFIPPHPYVRNNLQYQAAVKGMEDNDIYIYCSSLIELGKKFLDKKSLVLLKPLEAMLESRKTVSDEIVELAKKQGIDVTGKLSDENASQLALLLSNELFKDILLTKQSLIDVGNNAAD